MTDFADEASERTEAQIAAALANKMPEGPKATGYCLECGDELAKVEARGTIGPPREVRDMTRRWCNAQCRDDWEKREDNQ